jgi:hypothetical protein
MLVRRKRDKSDTEQGRPAVQAVVSTDWLPGRHFRLVADNTLTPCAPKPLRPAPPRNHPRFPSIHVQWPDTITCGHCRCVIALPAPARCPICHQNVPVYYVDRDVTAAQDAPPDAMAEPRPGIFRAPT